MPFMRKSVMIFFRGLIVFVGIGAVAFLLWEPHVEGRNVNATVYQIYFQDPFLAYAYIGSIPFFVALVHAFKVSGFFGEHKMFSPVAVKSLRTIKYCAMALIGFVAVGEIFIMLDMSDDRAGGVFMGLLVTLGAILMATIAAKLERKAAMGSNSSNGRTL
jgi:hypothetical protein